MASTGAPHQRVSVIRLGLDSKLRSCDLIKLRGRDICHGDRVAARATVMQQNQSLNIVAST